MISLARKIRAAMLALTLVLCVGVIGVRAQEQPSAAPSSSASPKSSSDKPEVKQGKPHEGGPGRQLVRESNKAAGEEDEMAEFKQSASVMMISRLTGLNPQRAYWLCVVLNFLVIALVIVWAGKKFLPGIFRDRTAAIQKAMQEAQKASAEARQKLAEIESQLQKLDVEISAMREAAEKEAAAEEARIKAAAHEDAQKIIAAAEQEIAAALKTARRQLAAHAADLAVGLAQKQIHVDAATDQALVRSFFGQLTDNPRKDGN